VDIFKPSDFDDIPINDTWDTSIVASVANLRLAKLIEAAPVVYSRADDKVSAWWPQKPERDITVQGRLLFITELPKKPCEHKGQSYQITALNVDTNNNFTSAVIGEEYKCIYCNIPLKPNWTPA